MRAIYFVCLLGASLLCALAAPVAAAGIDTTVVGLKPGMTLDEVTAKLGTGFKQSTTADIARGRVVNFTKGEEGFNVLVMGEKVVYIEHEQVFAPKEMLSAEELVKALAEKYGPPSMKSDEDQSEAWVAPDGKTTAVGDAVTDAVRACASYETQGPFFQLSADKINYAFSFPKVPVDPKLANCGMVIVAKPSLLPDNPGLITHLSVALFDVKASQDWFNQATIEYNKLQKDAVDAVRKNKPHL